MASDGFYTMVMKKIWAIQRWIRFRDIISNISEELIKNMSCTLFVCNKYIILQVSYVIVPLCLELNRGPKSFQNSFGSYDRLFVL